MTDEKPRTGPEDGGPGRLVSRAPEPAVLSRGAATAPALGVPDIACEGLRRQQGRTGGPVRRRSGLGAAEEAVCGGGAPRSCGEGCSAAAEPCGGAGQLRFSLLDRSEPCGRGAGCPGPVVDLFTCGNVPARRRRSCAWGQRFPAFAGERPGVAGGRALMRIGRAARQDTAEVTFA